MYEEEPQPLLHVMAGGGSGALLMRALADEHIPFVAGALNIGDSDHTLALRLATHVITEQPYAPISSTTLEQVRRSLVHVKLLIICPTAFGPGNLPLLQEAVRFAQNGRMVVLLTTPTGESVCAPSDSLYNDGSDGSDGSMGGRDYTGGVATHLIEQLVHNDALLVETVGKALEVVEEQLFGR